MGHCIVDQGLYIGPEGRGAISDVAVPLDDLGIGHTVFAPGGALGVIVVQEGLQAVQCVGVFRFGSLAGVELFPEGAKLGTLFWREQRKDAVGRPLLAIELVAIALYVIAEGVAGIDLDDVVNERHLQGSSQVNCGGRVFA